MSDPVIGDPRGDALAYLEQHKLLRLVNILGAKLACEKPEDPNAFLLAELSKASVMAARGQPVRSCSSGPFVLLSFLLGSSSSLSLTQPSLLFIFIFLSLSLSLQVTLFSEKDIEVMFGVFDLTNRGYVTQLQYLKALNSVGIETPALKTPVGDNIDRKTFVAYIMAEVLRQGF